MEEIRLIDANALKDRLAKHQSILDFEWNNDNLIASIIDNAPTVNSISEKIIRCQDCKYYHPFKHWCDVHEDWAEGEDDYCSLAKKEVMKNETEN